MYKNVINTRLRRWQMGVGEGQEGKGRGRKGVKRRKYIPQFKKMLDFVKDLFLYQMG